MENAKCQRRQITDEEFRIAYNDENNIRLIKSICREYSSSLDKDELERCGMIGLWRCLQYYNENLGVKFTTSLYRFIHWECKRELIKRKKPRPVTIECDGIYLDSSLKHEITDYLSQLCPEDRQLIISRFFEDKTLREIGRDNGFSKETARTRINTILRQLHKICT